MCKYCKTSNNAWSKQGPIHKQLLDDRCNGARLQRIYSFFYNIPAYAPFGVQRWGRSSRWTFQHRNVSTWGLFDTGNFWPKEFSAPCIFWYLEKQYGRFGTDILAPVLLCQNVHVLKCPCAEMFLCRKFLVPKRSPCQNIPMLKCPSAKTSAAPTSARAKRFP